MTDCAGIIKERKRMGGWRRNSTTVWLTVILGQGSAIFTLGYYAHHCALAHPQFIADAVTNPGNYTSLELLVR